MKPSTSLKTFLYLIFALICVTSVGCGPNFGEKLVVNGTEIYYKDGATSADAKRLGEQLEELKFIDGKTKSVQLLKRGSVWEFRMATSKSQVNEAATGPLKLFGLELSSAFDGDEVEVHLCNHKLESEKVVKGLRGKLYKFDKNKYFYKDVELDQVKGFAPIAFASQIDNGYGFNFYLSQPKSAVEIRVAYPNAVRGDDQMAGVATSAAVAASQKLFDGKQVDISICDLYFEKMNSYSSVPKAAPSTP